MPRRAGAPYKTADWSLGMFEKEIPPDPHTETASTSNARHSTLLMEG